MERRIVHLQVACFPVAVERVRDASLRQRPVAVSPGRSSRAVLTHVSAEARREGVHPGMLLAAARARCRDLRVIPPDADLQGRAMAALLELARRSSPLVEPGAGGSFFADLTGTDRLLGAARDTAWRLQREIGARLRLPGRIGLSINKLVSRVATLVPATGGLADIRPGDEAMFLSPLAARLLPAVRPAREGMLLADLNLRRVADVSALSLARLHLAFGERAPILYSQARGRDDSPVRPGAEQAEVHVEETLAEDLLDDRLLQGMLFLLVERAGRRLRASRRQPGAACLAVRLADHQGGSRGLRLASSPDGDDDLFHRLLPLLAALTRRRVRVRWLGLTLDRLQPLTRQLTLFGNGGAPPRHGSGTPGNVRERLSQALDHLRGRHGESAVRRLSPGVAAGRRRTRNLGHQDAGDDEQGTDPIHPGKRRFPR